MIDNSNPYGPLVRDLAAEMNTFEALPPVSGSEVFATTLRDITGMVITIEKGKRVRVTRQDDINGTCTLNLMSADNPTRIWNTIVGVPMKHLQFDPQNAPAMASPQTPQDTDHE